MADAVEDQLPALEWARKQEIHFRRREENSAVRPISDHDQQREQQNAWFKERSRHRRIRFFSEERENHERPESSCQQGDGQGESKNPLSRPGRLSDFAQASFQLEAPKQAQRRMKESRHQGLFGP